MGIKKKITNIVFSFTITLVFFASAKAQTGEMDLQQCLNYGLENSPFMTLSKNELEMFKYDKRDLYSNYLPSINGSFDLNYNAKLPLTVIPAGEFAPTEIRMKMGSPHANNAVLQLDQKIYDHSAVIGIKGVQDYQELAQLNSEKQVEDLLYSIASSYYQTLVVAQQIKLLEDNQKQYEELVKIMQLQLDKKVITTTDFNRIKVANNNISAQLSLMEVRKKDALNNLKRAIGMPLEEEIKINEQTLIADKLLPLAEEIDVTNRLDYKINLKNIDLLELNSRVTAASSLPTLSGFARYGANSYGENFNAAWEKFYDFASFGVKLTVPIFNGLKVNTAYHKTLIQLENLKAQSTIMEQGYKVESSNARTKLLEAQVSYSLNQENLELAKEVYDQTHFSYQKGAVSLSDFLNADFSYKEAQTNYLTSLINMLLSRLDYEKSKGNLSNYLNNK